MANETAFVDRMEEVKQAVFYWGGYEYLVDKKSALSGLKPVSFNKQKTPTVGGHTMIIATLRSNGASKRVLGQHNPVMYA